MSRHYRASVRLRLTLSYAGFLVTAGAAALMGVYVVLRYVPNYPLTFANPSDADVPIASRQEILEAVISWSLVILGALAVIGTAGGWWLAGRVLRPLTDLRDATRAVATGRLDHRVRLRGPRDEFAEVADSFDHMLDRLSDAFAAQERFSANAAHELRTPLSVSRTILDVELAAPGGADRQALERLSQTTDRAIELTEALLRLADANELTARHEPVDLAEVVAEALAEVGDEAAERGIAVETEVGPATVIGDATLLRRLTVNLLQNGVRHNRPDGGLWLRTSSGTGGARIEVESDGAPLDPALVARFVEPYLRGGGRTTGAADRPRGHGLGLALVDRIVAVHRGRLTLEPRSAGGLRVVVELP